MTITLTGESPWSCAYNTSVRDFICRSLSVHINERNNTQNIWDSQFHIKLVDWCDLSNHMDQLGPIGRRRPQPHFQDDAELGFILKVDLQYPSSLHDEHTQYPLAQRCAVVSNNILSKYGKALHSQNSDKPYQSTSKLTPNLFDKAKYSSL